MDAHRLSRMFTGELWVVGRAGGNIEERCCLEVVEITGVWVMVEESAMNLEENQGRV